MNRLFVQLDRGFTDREIDLLAARIARELLFREQNALEAEKRKFERKLRRQIEERDPEVRIAAFDEELAIRLAALDDGKTTVERAIEALHRPERFRSEHKCARHHIRDVAPATRIFSRLTT